MRHMPPSCRFRIVQFANRLPGNMPNGYDTSGSRFYQLTSRASRSVIISDETFATSVSQKSEPLNILQQQPQICSDLNKILHTQDNICYKHYYIVSYKSALTLLKYEFLNNTAHKSLVSIAVDVSQNSQNVHSSKRPVSSRKFSH